MSMDVEVTYNPTKNEGVKIKFNAPIFKRNNSFRGSKKKREMQLKAMQKSSGLKVALIILNSDYSSTKYSMLHGVEADGNLMKEMLLCYDDVVIKKDVENIEEAVVEFCAKHKYSRVERLHFHYSGHGVENATVEIDSHAYTVEDDIKTFVGVTPTGGCMIGCAGKLYSTHDLKIELLESNPTWLTLTLDCCRSSNITRGEDAPKQCVMLKNKTMISNEDQEKIAVIHGTSDLHPAGDANTFTQELHKVYEGEELQIPILQIVSKVNKSWKDRGIRQICKLDFVEVGSNWKFYMWPNPQTLKPFNESISDMIETQTEREIKPEKDTGGDMENIIKRMSSLLDEFDRKTDATRIQEMVAKQVSEVLGEDDSRKRKRPKRSTIKT